MVEHVSERRATDDSLRVRRLRPLNGTEELLWLLDVPSDPQTSHIELDLPGPIDADRLRRAASRVLAAYEMARVRLDRWSAKTRQLAWVVPDEVDDDPV